VWRRIGAIGFSTARHIDMASATVFQERGCPPSPILSRIAAGAEGCGATGFWAYIGGQGILALNHAALPHAAIGSNPSHPISAVPAVLQGHCRRACLNEPEEAHRCGSRLVVIVVTGGTNGTSNARLPPFSMRGS